MLPPCYAGASAREDIAVPRLPAIGVTEHIMARGRADKGAVHAPTGLVGGQPPSYRTSADMRKHETTPMTTLRIGAVTMTRKPAATRVAALISLWTPATFTALVSLWVFAAFPGKASPWAQ